MSNPTCIHCRTRPQAKDKRALCWACYLQPPIRLRYPSRRVSHDGCWPDDTYPPCSAPTPTDAPPGSAAKVKVLEDRCERGEELHTDGDVRIDVDMAGWRTAREEVA